jgi:hypothetical protein
MEYDATSIPAGYDLARSHTPEVLDLWMNTNRLDAQNREKLK